MFGPTPTVCHTVPAPVLSTRPPVTPSVAAYPARLRTLESVSFIRSSSG